MWYRCDGRRGFFVEPEELTNPVVRSVVIAMRDGDRQAFLGAFAPSAKLTDDGNAHPLAEWADREIFRAHGSAHGGPGEPRWA